VHGVIVEDQLDRRMATAALPHTSTARPPQSGTL
jgi:hypothetical protein